MKLNTLEPPFNILSLMVLLHVTFSFRVTKSEILLLHFLHFKIYFSLMFTSSASKTNLAVISACEMQITNVNFSILCVRLALTMTLPSTQNVYGLRLYVMCCILW
jgi:hypothetical protein